MNLSGSKFVKRYKEGLRNLPESILGLFFTQPDECLICGEPGDIICGECSGKIERHEAPLCEKCGRHVESEGLCPQCEKNERPYDKGVIALYYQDHMQEAMKEYKFSNKLTFADFFAQEIFNKISEFQNEIDIVTAVPSHFIKVMGKGYNPPGLIAKKLARMIDAKYSAGILRRIRYTKSMSLLKGIDRMEHAGKNFAFCGKDIEGKNILIVDDVSTTGATLHVCAEILKKNGAGKIFVAAACGDKNISYGEAIQDAL